MNHQAFFLKLACNGEDLYPRLRRLVETDRAVYDRERVRNEMLLHLDYYVTESSGHNSDYNPWFRKRPDLIEKYCSPHDGSGWNPGEYAFSLNLRLGRRETWRAEITDWIEEYAANIFNARFGDGTPFPFNANVLNGGTIPNLPADACVEVPVLADRSGYTRLPVGPLPAHLAILVNTTAQMENLVVEAVREKDKRKVFHAVCMDPLTSAVCSLAEIRQMCDELFTINEEFLQGWKY